MINIYGDFRRVLLSALEDLAREGALPAGIDVARVAVEPPRDPAHGDLATNAAMVLAGRAKQNPMALAEKIAAALQGRELTTGDYRGSGFTVHAARPGFLNIRLDPAIWHAQLRAILNAGTAYGDSTIGQREKVNVEFVSANPTGPMHVGHGRGAVVGDALAALLAKAGFAVHREYYINDAGAQVDALARSLYYRYQEVIAAEPESRLLHSSGTMHPAPQPPEGLYPGEYLKDTARKLFERDGEKWFGKPEGVWLAPVRDFAIADMLGLIRDDLAVLGIGFDVFVSERELVKSGAVDAALAALTERGLIYEGVL
ncbi:MAG: arginine--tRNA ligase, partial [Alphaproteobacteria bacterium]|nr:arginine--tRNA ligase [Alphaproteobacteria bacterium]